MNANSQIAAVCQRAYDETKRFYTRVADRCDNLGFEILYGPPLHRPDMLLLGYQPGGGAQSPEDARARYPLPDRWPDTSAYVTAPWPLAGRLRDMFGTEPLTRSVGLNAIFVRSPKIAAYGTIDGELRNEISHFCLPHVIRIIDAVDPVNVVVMGFATLRLFGAATPDRCNAKGRVLTSVGTIAGRRAIAMLHPSGAHISGEDRRAIADRVLAFR
jgi:hypothetical protein